MNTTSYMHYFDAQEQAGSFSQEHCSVNTEHFDLGDDKPLDQILLEDFPKQLDEVIPFLIHGRTYPLRTLCGEQLWSLMHRNNRRMVSNYLQLLIDDCNGFKLDLAEVKAGGEKLYRLK